MKKIGAYLLKLATLVLVYFGAGKVGLSLAFLNASASAVWPPTGIALAALALLGARLWPAVLVGAFLVNLTTAGTFLTSLAIAVGNTLEAVAGAWLLKRFADGRHAFDRPLSVFKFVVLVAMLSTLISASCGVSTLTLAGLASWKEFGIVWLTWWIGDLVSNLVVAPVLLVWMGTPPSFKFGERKIEALGLGSLLLITCLIVFEGFVPAGAKNYPLEYLTIPLLLWSVFRFGQHGGTAALALIAGVAITGTLSGFGPFALHEPNRALLLLQAFLSTISLTALTLGAVVTDRENAGRRLQLQHSISLRLAHASDLHHVCDDVLQTLAQSLQVDLAALWVKDPTGPTFQAAGAWHEPSPEALAFGDAIRSQSVICKTESPSADSTEASGLYRFAVSEVFVAAAARSHGLEGVLLFPIETADKCQGVLGFFERNKREGKSGDLEFLAAVAIALGQFIERAQAESHLRESEHRYAQILDSLADMILCKAPGSIVTYVNKATCDYYGMTADQLRGIMDVSFNLPNHTQQYLIDDQKVFSTGSSLDIPEELNVRKDGQVRIFHTIKSPIFDTNGNVVELVAVCRDVTERKQAEEKLSRSQDRFRHVVMASAHVVWTMSADGQVIEDLPTWRAFTGQTSEQMKGNGWFQRIHPEDRDRTRRVWENSLANKSPHEQEFRVCAADGSYRHVVERAVPVFEGAGVIREWVGTITDITAKKYAEEALRDSEQRYRALAETSPAGIWQTTPTGETLFINPAMCRLLELDSKAEMHGKTYRDFYTPASIERVKQEHAKRARGISSSYEVEIVGRRGSRRHLLICGAPLHGPDGTVHSFIATLTDITPQKNALEALRGSERRFQTLADNSPDVIARFDRNRRYLYVSPSLEAAFGRHPGDFIGKTNREAGMPEEFCAQWDAGIDRVFEAKTEWADECSLSVGGELRHFHSRWVPELAKDDRVETALVVTRDITELKQAEAEIKRLNQDLERRVQERTALLQQTNDQLEAFCYSVSHDLRAPLRAMQGFTEALIEDCSSILDEAGKDYTRRISNAARRMDRLIQDLLEYSRLGRMSLTFRKVQVGLVLHNVLRQLDREIRERNAEIIAPRPFPDLLANETLLEQVLINLVSNAIKFVPPDTPPRVTIEADENGQTVRLTVKDNGIGIDPTHHERIFRVFERLHGMEKYPGTGIGLAIVRKGIERMGGQVGVDSKPGEGSCFWIALPKAIPDEPQQLVRNQSG